MKTLIVSIRIFLVLTVLTGIAYPLLVFGIGQVFFPSQTAGSLIEKDGKIIGSKLIAQKFSSDRYFHSRPSATDYATLPSGASNFGPPSAALRDEVNKRRMLLGPNAPDDLLTASGSGLDPHLSPSAVFFQVPRVLSARKLDTASKEKLSTLISSLIEEPQFGFLGAPRVNILALNLAVDTMFP